MASLVVPFMSRVYFCYSAAKVKILAKDLLGDFLEDGDFYIESNGRIVAEDDVFLDGHRYYMHLRVLGGKGGFGSMLRSIGAQIEKTTNREACRDLSGRRMRDINNEKRLQDWAAKAADREKAKAERRRERRERMKAGASRHHFDDPQYQQQKAAIAENLDDALEEGLMRAGPSSSSAASAAATEAFEFQSRKRKHPLDKTSVKKQARHWLADDVDVDLSSSSEESNGDFTMVDVTATTSSTVDQDDNDACCGYKVCPPAAAGAATATETIAAMATEDMATMAASAKETVVTKATSAAATLATASSESSRWSSNEDEMAIAATSTTESHGSGGTEDNSMAMINAQAEIPSTATHSAPADTLEQITLPPPQTSGDSLDLDQFGTVSELERVGLEGLKAALMCRGLKCGGTLQQRAERLFSVKGLSHDDIPPSLFAKPPRK